MFDHPNLPSYCQKNTKIEIKIGHFLGHGQDGTEIVTFTQIHRQMIISRQNVFHG